MATEQEWQEAYDEAYRVHKRHHLVPVSEQHQSCERVDSTSFGVVTTAAPVDNIPVCKVNWVAKMVHPNLVGDWSRADLASERQEPLVFSM